jgi:hypothetical protein
MPKLPICWVTWPDAEHDGSLVLAAEELLAEGLAAYAVRAMHERRRAAG